MFQTNDIKTVQVFLDYDPAADDVLPVWRAPAGATVVGAYATITNALAGSGTNYFSLTLRNGGTAGTATTTMGSAIGGTVGWTALVPAAWTISSGALAAGELVQVVYDEEGTGTFTSIVVQVDYVFGEIN